MSEQRIADAVRSVLAAGEYPIPDVLRIDAPKLVILPDLAGWKPVEFTFLMKEESMTTDEDKAQRLRGGEVVLQPLTARQREQIAALAPYLLDEIVNEAFVDDLRAAARTIRSPMNASSVALAGGEGPEEICRANRLDYMADKIAASTSSAADGTKPWNHVVLGDGTRAVLVPGPACINVITEADGHRSCNHTDATACDRTGHQTISLHEVIREGEPGYFPPSGDPTVEGSTERTADMMLDDEDYGLPVTS